MLTITIILIALFGLPVFIIICSLIKKFMNWLEVHFK